ncbi:MAG: YhbY family RNA-binding protein [Oscillospiraceae bacterium]|nr:YhbY family RNA-binding protein [Oscillospiraceae bacterium]
MITTKQRAKLRAIANGIETIFQVGKGGINEAFAAQVDDALRAREIVKIKVLENSLYTAREAAGQLSEMTGADVVQVIGNRFVLYKRNEKEPVIILE